MEITDDRLSLLEGLEEREWFVLAVHFCTDGKDIRDTRMIVHVMSLRAANKPHKILSFDQFGEMTILDEVETPEEIMPHWIERVIGETQNQLILSAA